MANGASRLTLAQNVIKKESQKALNDAYKNENDTAKSVKKIPLKNPTKNNHSK